MDMEARLLHEGNEQRGIRTINDFCSKLIRIALYGS